MPCASELPTHSPASDPFISMWMRAAATADDSLIPGARPLSRGPRLCVLTDGDQAGESRVGTLRACSGFRALWKDLSAPFRSDRVSHVLHCSQCSDNDPLYLSHLRTHGGNIRLGPRAEPRAERPSVRGWNEPVRSGDLGLKGVASTWGDWGKRVPGKKGSFGSEGRTTLIEVRAHKSHRKGSECCCRRANFRQMLVFLGCFPHQTHCRGMWLTQLRTSRDGSRKTRDDATLLRPPADEEPGFSLVTVQRIQLRRQLSQQISWWEIFTS